jgi:simple sugar transport system permease protein
VIRWALGIAGLLLVLVATLAILGLPIADSLRLLYEGALSDKYGIHRTLLKSAPLILVGLGMVISWRAGMFNIGGEGQLLCGAAGGAALAHALGSPPALLICFVAALAGALYAGLAGWLFVKRGVNIVISTILLNFVALH